MADVSTRLVTVVRHPGLGMITLRCDLGNPALDEALDRVAGCRVPDIRRIEAVGDCAVAWMSPDELMVFCPEEEAPGLADALDAALAGAHALVLDVTDARAVFRIEGRAARELLAKGAPVDLAPEAFGTGDFRRTRVGQVAAAFWMPAPGRIELMCFRSVSDYMSHWLETAARDGAFPGVLVEPQTG